MKAQDAFFLLEPNNIIFWVIFSCVFKALLVLPSISPTLKTVVRANKGQKDTKGGCLRNLDDKSQCAYRGEGLVKKVSLYLKPRTFPEYYLLILWYLIVIFSFLFHLKLFLVLILYIFKNYMPEKRNWNWKTCTRCSIFILYENLLKNLT